MNNFLLGWALAQTAITLFCVFLLYKKPTTHNEIDNLKQKNKRNKGSNIDNDISANMETKKPEKGLFKNKKLRIFKRKNK